MSRETMSALLPFDNFDEYDPDFAPPIALSTPTNSIDVDLTADEEVGQFVPDKDLAAAIDDAKVLVLSYHETEPSNLLAYTWYLTRAGVPCAGKSCPMHLSGRSGKVTFNTVIGASEDGTWTVLQSNGTATKTYQSLHLALHDQLAPLLKRGKHVLPAQAHRYEYIQPAGNTADIVKDNAEVYSKYLDAGENAMFYIKATPFPQPHVVISTVDTADGAERYVLGYHPRSRFWFLADPHEAWATVSPSLPALLTSIVRDTPDGPQ